MSEVWALSERSAEKSLMIIPLIVLTLSGFLKLVIWPSKLDIRVFDPKFIVTD